MPGEREPDGVGGHRRPRGVTPYPGEQTYASAGVDLDAAQSIKERIKRIAAPTYGPQVLSGVGGFGALYELSGYQEPVLVSSTDGVGTKLKLAITMGRLDSIGEDLVNLCVNDIAVTGAKPLFFLDYVATGRLDPARVEELVAGMARACRQVDCALIGGETAQMPGLYEDEDFDLAGFVVGVVEKGSIPDTSKISEGDQLLGVPSAGLHTNGYSLVRHALGLDDDPSPLREFVPELGQVLGDALLTAHRPYYPMTRRLLPLVKGMAHITGGGLIENVPRVLPEGLAGKFDREAWEVPTIFTFLQEQCNVNIDEMYRVFNMGLGMVLVSDKSSAQEIFELAPECRAVGEVVRARGERRVVV